MFLAHRHRDANRDTETATQRPRHRAPTHSLRHRCPDKPTTTGPKSVWGWKFGPVVAVVSGLAHRGQVHGGQGKAER